MVLVDTSSWIETLRAGGNAAVRERVGELVLEGDAAWCDMVRLELWHGVRGAREREEILQLEKVVSTLDIDGDVWVGAMALARAARAQGLTVPSPDLLIVATAQHYQVKVDSIDAHMERLMKMK